MKKKPDLKELTNLLTRTREELESVITEYFCVASAVADKRSDVISHDMFYHLFREAWFEEDKNGNPDDMKELIENAFGREVKDITFNRTEWDTLNVDFTDSKTRGRYSIQIPAHVSRCCDVEYDTRETERLINSIAIKLYRVVDNDTITYSTIISFPNSEFDCGVRDQINEFFNSI